MPDDQQAASDSQPDHTNGDTPSPDNGDTNQTLDDPGKRALDAERTARKAAEKARRDALAELDKIRQQGMSDTEKAVAEAEKRGRQTVIEAMGRRLVDAEVKAAVGDRNVDVAALLEGLDRSRFMTDDGEPDEKAIRAWVDRIAPPPAQNGPPQFGDPLAQGRRGNANPGSPDMNQMIRRAAGRT